MLLRVANLSVCFTAGLESFAALDDVNLDVDAGRTVALVGESGCGKSLTALSILDLLPPAARVDRGAVVFEDRTIVAASPPPHVIPAPREARHRRRHWSRAQSLRGNRIAMIFQEPMTSLNPVLTIGRQIAEPLETHRGISRRAARARAIELLEQVGIADPAARIDEYPHRLSGGMRQRVMIAMALACEPALLIADEPTTALDVTVQAQILSLLRDLQQRRGTALLFITHDLGVVAQVADEVCVMYAGRVVERAPVGALFARPRHPYTQALLQCTPRVATGAALATPTARVRLAVVPGEVADPRNRPSGCAFHPRCALAAGDERCQREAPALESLAADHACACWRATDRSPNPARRSY
ncbi:MAG: ABC transporter ATP-binding protein [Phycisphaerae bacterium]